MMGDHERGLAFVKGVAIDQHLLRRNRQFDLLEVIGARPDLLGIGIDEDTAIVVQGDVFEVIGRSYVAIYDAADRAHQGRDFRLLSAGRRFDLNKRVELAPEQPSQISKQADEYLRRVGADGAFSGAALVARGGEVLLSRGYGFDDREWKIPVKSDTKFRLGSITKQFTAAAILQLQERGLLQVGDLLSKHLPDYPQGGRITIHHLLTHTSGTPTYTVPSARPDMVLPMSREQLLDRFQNQPLEFEPGSDWRYSNSGYYLLGVIVETVSGAPYEQYLQRNIFEPLGMSGTGYDRSEDVLPKRAAGYRRTKHGIENARYADMSWPYAAGALYSTIEDLYRWDRALAEGGILSDKSREQAFAKQFTKQGVGSYGYGWAVGERLGRRYVEHGGGINGFSTMISRYIDDDAVIIVLSNIENANARRHADELAKILFGKP
jgi:CubicO group peptidase (beta-lactamase class C family)